MIPGNLKYTIEQITYQQPHHLLTYDEVLDLIKNWGGGELHSNKHMLIKTNYPWVYKSVKEIKGEINDYKLLVLPSIQLFDRKTLAKVKAIILQDKYAHLYELLNMLPNVPNLTKFHRKIMENDEKKLFNLQHLIMKKYIVTMERIEERINSNIHFVRNICTIQMKGNTTLLTLLQGRKSMIRNVIPRKVTSLRTQIFVHPCLKPNQIILPVAWAHMFGAAPTSLVNIHSSKPIPQECFHILKTQRISCKRDPAIGPASVSILDEVAFAITEMLFVSMAEMESKNADCDGDMESNSVTDDILSVHELTLNMSPRNKILVYNKPRISFTESLILYMHQREFDNDCFPYAKFYNFIRKREIHKWIQSEHNRQILTSMHAKYPQYKIINYIEPTRIILQKMLTYLPLIDSSKAALDFYTFINENVLRLANGANTKEASPLYDPKLPCDYFMKNDILCESIIRICMSNAKGCLETLQIFADRIHGIDGTTRLTTKIASINKNFIIKQSDTISQTMANKSRQVAINGHNFFKSNIAYDTINFDNNNFKNNDLILIEDLNFLHPCLLLPPDICFALTFLRDLK